MRIRLIGCFVIVVIVFSLVACSQEPFINQPTVTPPPVTDTPQPHPPVDTILTDATSTPTKTISESSTPFLDAEADSTPVFIERAEIHNTLLLYTTNDSMSESGSFSVSLEYWPLRVWPSIPYFEQPVFETFYKVAKGAGDDINYHLSSLRPRISPNGRYILLPGSDYNPNSDWGRGLLLVDLQAETPEDAVHQLLPEARTASWSPDSDAIAYVNGATLYTLAIGEGAVPIPLFSHPNIWSLYAQWSPDGRWIATVTTIQQEPDGQGSPELVNTIWLVPANGEPARELTTQMDFAMEYTANEMAWSPDGQFLLMRNQIFDLEGDQLSPDYFGRVSWLPAQSGLLVNGEKGLHLVTVSGEEITAVSDTFAEALAFSRDGQKLAYSQPGDAHVNLFIFDLTEQKGQLIGSVSLDYVSDIHWSGDDAYLILSGKHGSNNQIWVMPAWPDNTVELFQDEAVLIETIVYLIQQP